MTDREHLAAMAQALVRDGLLKRRRGGWYEVLLDVHRLPEHARCQVTEIQQITRHTGETILARTLLNQVPAPPAGDAPSPTAESTGPSALGLTRRHMGRLRSNGRGSVPRRFAGACLNRGSVSFLFDTWA